MKHIVRTIKLALLMLLLGNAQADFKYLIQTGETDKDSSQTDIVLMIRSNTGDISKIDPETGDLFPYYQSTSGFTLLDWSINTNNRDVYIVKVTGTGTVPSRVGEFELIQVDLDTGEQTAIFKKENLSGIRPHPKWSNHLILRYFLGTRLPGTPRSDSDRYNICILDLVTLSCEELHRDTSLLLTGKFVHWLDERTFLAPGGRDTGGSLLKMDAFTGESEDMLPGWSVFALASFHTTNKMLLVAQPAESSGYSSYGDNIAGFYILDLDTFTLSDKLFDTPLFDYAGVPILSPNDEYFIYSWLKYPDESGSVVFDLKTGAVMADLNNIASNTWLPDGRSLIGATTTPDHYFTAVVTVDVQTGEITKLFDIDERVYFTVAN